MYIKATHKIFCRDKSQQFRGAPFRRRADKRIALPCRIGNGGKMRRHTRLFRLLTPLRARPPAERTDNRRALPTQRNPPKNATKNTGADLYVLRPRWCE